MQEHTECTCLYWGSGRWRKGGGGKRVYGLNYSEQTGARTQPEGA